MKSYGGIMQEAASYATLRESFDYVLRGVKRKTCPTGRNLMEHRDEVIAELQQELLTGTFHIKGYKQFTIIKTKEGEGRYLVFFSFEDGRDGKFFTNSDELKQLLDKIKDIGEIPFRTKISKKVIGENKYKYCFT